MRQVILSIIMLLFSVSSFSQKVERQGNTFTQVSTAKESKATKTQYIYKTKDGQSYPIYLSAKGKAFIIKVSKKTGKEYKQYLPEVTEQLSKK